MGAHEDLLCVHEPEYVSTSLKKEDRLMRIGSSLVLIAIGAILTFALTTSVSGINLDMVGIVLMVVGIGGLIISLVMANTARRTDVVHHSARRDYVEPLPPDDPRV